VKTVALKKEDVRRRWYLVDAKDKVLGRLASKLAQVLSGKGKVNYTPHVDGGDYVVVVNAASIRLTGKKLDRKRHYSYSGYPGGLKAVGYRTLLEKYPERALRMAVKGMLPHTKLGSAILGKLKVCRDSKHLHEAQRPEPLEL